MPFHIPLRTSSVNAPTSAMLSPNNSRRDHKTRSMHKAQKILGTTDISLDHDYHKRPEKKTSRRPSFLNAPDITYKQDDGETNLPSPRLRVRASSPLLGQEYRETGGQPPLPESSRDLHLSGSASALYSHYSSRQSPPASSSSLGAAANGRLQVTAAQHSDNGLKPAFKQPKGPMKDSKRKTRPPRIDLSLLFPKPQTNSTPLLSPQRMVSSPSAISMVSEYPTVKAGKIGGRQTAKRLTKAAPLTTIPPHAENGHQTLEGALNSSVSPDTEGSEWMYSSIERTVRTAEMDLALEKDSISPSALPPTDRVRYSLNFSSRSREQLPKGDSKSVVSARSRESARSSQNTLREIRSNIPQSSRSDGIAGSAEPFRFGLRGNNSLNKGPMMSKKSSKSTLTNADLNTSSVLCLSSSEDEDDDEEAFKPQNRPNRSKRDSVDTYGELDAEICTAAAAQAARVTLRSVERPSSSTTRDSRSTRQSLNVRRDSSASLARRPSVTRKPSTAMRDESRRSSGVPAILEPDFFYGDPMSSQERKPSVSRKEINRRSRLMAVTRQEEHLLEKMRQRQGKITPSIFNEALEPDRRSIISGPSRDSFYCSDTSFLRLSPGVPPSLTSALHGPNHTDKSASTPQGSGSDSEGKTTNSIASPRASSAYSESLPSPATSGASPLTPTLPIHRFSPLPSQKPPPRRPPPPIPDLKQHSRRRTDSSEAIVLDNSVDGRKDSNDFPVWALGWNNEGGNVTAVH